MLEFLQVLFFGSGDGLLCFWPMLAAGAALGALQYNEKSKQADAQRKLAATTALYSPWTGLTPDTKFDDPSTLGTVGQGALMGGIMGASMGGSPLANNAATGAGAGAGTGAVAGSTAAPMAQAGQATQGPLASQAELATQQSTMPIDPETQAMYQDIRLGALQNPELELARQNTWLNMPRSTMARN